jgi:hypothetical protein
MKNPVALDKWASRFSSSASGISVRCRLERKGKIVVYPSRYDGSLEFKAELQSICFQQTGVWPKLKGDMFFLDHRSNNTPSYIKKIVENQFEGHERALFLYWWDFLARCGINCQPDHKDAAVGVFELDQDYPNYYGWAGICVMMDLPQRYPGIISVVKHLEDRIKGADPWLLLQIAHFIPWNHLGVPAKKLDADKIEWIGQFKRDQTNHCCGSMSGEFSLVKSLKQSVQSANETCKLSGGFFPYGNANRTPDPDWTWEEFAEYAKNYIDSQFKKEKAA